MVPLPGPDELSTAIPGDVLTASSPNTSSIVKKSEVVFTGLLHVAPLSVDLAKLTLLVLVPGNLRQAR